MNKHLLEVIEISRLARDKLIAGELSPKEANGIAAQNHNIIGAYALDLRERIFDAEMTNLAPRVGRIGAAPNILES